MNVFKLGCDFKRLSSGTLWWKFGTDLIKAFSENRDVPQNQILFKLLFALLILQ